MNRFKTLNARRLSVAGFSFLFAYILSFQFEGQVLYLSLIHISKKYPINTKRAETTSLRNHRFSLSRNRMRMFLPLKSMKWNASRTKAA